MMVIKALAFAATLATVSLTPAGYTADATEPVTNKATVSVQVSGGTLG